MLEAIDDVFPPGEQGFKFAEYMAAYIVIRKQATHKDAAAQVKALVRALLKKRP